MTGTGAHYEPEAPAGGGLPAPKLSLDAHHAAPVGRTLWDTTPVTFRQTIHLTWTQIPEETFADPDLRLEARLFRYLSAKRARGNGGRVPARWTPVRHIEGGVNPYNSSIWLGGTPVSAGDRAGRVLASAATGYGARVDITNLATNWMVAGFTRGFTSPGVDVQQPQIVSTWRQRRAYPSRAWGYRQSARMMFAIGFVGATAPGRWALMSPLTKFQVTSREHPWRFNVNEPAWVEEDATPPVFARPQRFVLPNPWYNFDDLEIRLTDSEWLPGGG